MLTIRVGTWEAFNKQKMGNSLVFDQRGGGYPPFSKGIYSSSGTILLPHGRLWGTNLQPHVQISNKLQSFRADIPNNQELVQCNFKLQFM